MQPLDYGTMPSRRDVMTAGAALAAAVTAGSALAQTPGEPRTASQSEPGQANGRFAVANPRKEFPRPPFPKQEQPWPGLQSKMDPKPDCGEQSYRGSGQLAGRKALVTGGDSGIGRAAAIAFAREGADVAINFLPQEEPDAAEVVELIRSAGRKAVALPGDIRDEQFCQKLVTDAVQGMGGLDLLVNVAARQHSLPSIDELTSEFFDWTVKTNLYAMFWITKAAVPRLPAGGAIINTASIEAFDPDANLLDYAMTKGGIVTFTMALAKQLAPKGIRVNAVAPGPFWTPLQVTGGQPPEALPQFGAKTPMGRAGQPVELAPTYVMLASDASSYTTGEIVGVTGGKSLS